MINQWITLQKLKQNCKTNNIKFNKLSNGFIDFMLGTDR